MTAKEQSAALKIQASGRAAVKNNNLFKVQALALLSVACSKRCNHNNAMPSDYPPLTVRNQAAWGGWLNEHSATATGVRLTLTKRKDGNGETVLKYNDALDEALCYGWIDSWGKGIDEDTRFVTFTPRTKTSSWSQRNKNYVARLEAAGQMTEAGRAAIAAAQADGRWDRAYSTPSTFVDDPDFMAALENCPKAKAYFATLNRSSRYMIYLRISLLKTEAGKRKRISAFLDMMERGEMPVPSQKRAGVKAMSKRKGKKLDEEEG